MMTARSQRIADRLGRCVHFTGLYGPGMVKHETCAADVRYDDVCVRHEPMAYRGRDGIEYKSGRSFPCLSSPGGNCAGATCEKRTLPTLEQVTQEIAKRDAAIGRILKARAAIVADGKNSGAIACPNCTGGQLAYARADNGHYTAKCSTEDCAAWIE